MADYMELFRALGADGNYAMKVYPQAFPRPLTEEENGILVTVNNRAATRQAIINAYLKTGKDFVERSKWSLRKNLPSPVNIDQVKKDDMDYDWDYTMVAIHHAGMSYSCGGSDQIHKVEETHMKKNKWPDIGYHYAMDCQGKIYEARDIRFKGSHLTKYNTGAIGIVLLEDLTTDGENGYAGKWDKLWQDGDNAIPPVQQKSLEQFISILCTYFNINMLGGHREFPKQDRSCPGNLGIKLVNELRKKHGLQAPKK